MERRDSEIRMIDIIKSKIAECEGEIEYRKHLMIDGRCRICGWESKARHVQSISISNHLRKVHNINRSTITKEVELGVWKEALALYENECMCICDKCGEFMRYTPELEIWNCDKCKRMAMKSLRYFDRPKAVMSDNKEVFGGAA